MKDPDFESGIVKLQPEKGSQLNKVETFAVLNLKKSPVSEATVNDDTKPLSLADRADKEQRIEQSATDLG